MKKLGAEEKEARRVAINAKQNAAYDPEKRRERHVAEKEARKAEKAKERALAQQGNDEFGNPPPQEKKKWIRSRVRKTREEKKEARAEKARAYAKVQYWKDKAVRKKASALAAKEAKAAIKTNLGPKPGNPANSRPWGAKAAWERAKARVVADKEGQEPCPGCETGTNNHKEHEHEQLQPSGLYQD